MEHSFWHQRWQEDRIGFHLPDTNSLLAKHLPSLQLNADDKFFVPLCGKTLDLLYLKQCGFKVIGNELNSLAVNAFFNENNIPFSTQSLATDESDDLLSFQSEDIEIIKGDFFSLEHQFLEDIDAVYDRASMIALPKEMRDQYVQHLLNILPKKIKILLITLEYERNLKAGPPFSISEKDVQRYYADDFEISLLEIQEIPMNQSAEVSKKLTMLEKVYLLQR